MPAGTETRTQKRRTYRTEREMKTLRYTYLVGLALTMLATLATGCQDDPLFSAPGYDGGGTMTRVEMDNPGPLQRNGNGRWVATRQVPLVGAGRVADDIGESLVKLIDFTPTNQNSLFNMFDANLDNYAELKGSLADVDVLASAAVSVRDIYHVYEANQKVGFVIKSGSAGVINVDVLKTFFIETYLNGDRQESLGSEDQSSDLLSLDLFTPANSEKQTIVATATKPFDEIRLCFGGVSVNVLSGMRIYYAFVGENKEHVITKDEFPNASFIKDGGWGIAGILDDEYKFWNADDAGPTYGGLYSNPSLELSLGSGATVPAGSEVGFKLTTGELLSIDLFSSTILEYTYSDGSKKESTVDENGIGIGLLGGGGQLISTYPEDKTKAISGWKITIKTGGLVGLIGSLFKGGSVSYAFYRDPVQIDPSYYFGIGNDTISTNSYRLPKPEEGTVTYEFLGCKNGEGAAAAVAPEKDYTGAATDYWMLHGMTVDGDYYMKATYTAPDNADDTKGEQIEYFFTIRRETETVPTCHTPITVGNYPRAKAVSPTEGSGCLLCIGSPDVDGEHVAGNVADANTNNYAGTVGGIQVASQTGIVAIDAGQEIGIDGEMRVGFVLQNVKQFLDLNALQFFRIRVLAADGKEVADGTPHQNEGVGLGLLGGAGNKIRYSIKADKPFRYVELYSAGLANINLSALRVYYAFWEDASDQSCAETLSSGIPGDACISMISAQQNHADINYAVTDVKGIADALSPISFASLGNVLDANRNTAAVVPVGANVGGDITLGIKFDKLKANQAIGVILRSPSGLADIDALTTGTTIQAFDGNDQNTVSTEEGAGFQTAGVKLFGSGDRYALEITPTQDFDRIKITFTQGLLTALEDFLVYGIYYRPDANGDGIPDCSENPDEEESGGININLETADVCEGDPIVINAVAGVGTPNQEVFYLRFLLSEDSNPNATEEEKEVIIPVYLNKSKQQLVAAESGKPLLLEQYGIYSVALYDNDTDFDDKHKVSTTSPAITVHNEQTAWTGATGDHDWNTWDNWSNGSPWTCTNVIIPGELANNYPWLDKADANYCNNLYIKDGGQLVNSFYLTQYNQAWVDVELESGRYYMLASPLKDMMSGDWFVNDEANRTWSTFSTLNAATYPEERIDPTIYQRLWSKNAPVMNPDGYEDYNKPADEVTPEVTPDETRWTPPYNSVAQDYPLGMGFSVMAGKEKGQGLHTFRFPKAHTVYHYYNLLGNPTGQTEQVHGDRALIGRFVYETDGDKQWQEQGIVTVNVQAAQANETARLVGNPFVAHVDVAAFMRENGVSEIKVFDGTTNANNSLILIDGELVSSNGNTLKYIKPLEAFFVMNYQGPAVTFTENMLTAGDATPTTRASRASSSLGPSLFLTASLGGTQSRALLRVSPAASAAVVPGEDTRLLLEGEAHPDVAIYTVADGQALDIQQVPADVDRIPLGFYLPDGDKADIRLTPEFTDPRWHDWWLVDLRTGQRRRLNTAAVTLHGVTSGSGQYALMKNSPINQ